MHIELVVPALLPAREPAGNPVPLRMPALELLLARGRRSNGTPGSLESWLSRAFGVEGHSSLPAGALTAHAHGLVPGNDHWLRADPVHLRADRGSLLLIPNQAFSIAAVEAEGLAAALARSSSCRRMKPRAGSRAGCSSMFITRFWISTIL